MKGGRLYGLDALRGFAALAVMLHHFGRSILHLPLVPEGYLAVDFFFILSGFVIDRAYRSQFLDGLSFGAFAQQRLARLYPTMAIGIVCGAVVAMLGGMSSAELGARYIAQLLFIPIPGPGGQIYQLDGVQWSLLFELFANVVHALLLSRLNKRGLAAIAVVSFAAFIAAARLHGGVGVGDIVPDFWGGVPRSLFGYTVGILLNRLSIEGRLPSPRLPAAVPVVMFAFAVVAAGAFGSITADFIAILIFPVIIIAGAAVAAGRDGIGARLGSLSYPLYATHLPAMNFAKLLPIGPLAQFALALALALLAARMVQHAVERPPRSRLRLHGQSVLRP
jgi:peptidoglycan/LPS O-acetylase OafA/YrhL